MIRQNFLQIREKIASVCSGINRDPAEITIVAVAKNRLSVQIKEAIDAGIYDIGENRVQEALAKFNDLRSAIGDMPLHWHMVGHLQTNKVKEATKLFTCIQSVDSLRLAREIDKQAAKIGKVQDIILEVKTSPEATKFGLKPQELPGTMRELAGLKNLNVLGLMTIAPLLDDPEQSRPYFRQLRELRDEINRQSVLGYRLSALSMGMTDDFVVAIEEGSTMVRLGRAIFED
jgi:pyridoxal phosphate enzyme (YggS family)